MRPALLAAIRVAAFATAAVGILLLLLIPAHSHDWMREMDPTIGPGDIEDGSGNGRIAAGLVAILAGLAALLAAVTGRGRRVRGLAVGAGVLVAIIWLARFAGV